MAVSPKILDGKRLSRVVQRTVADKVSEHRASGSRKPGLGVILVGDNPASKTYVANKGKFAQACGFETFDITLPQNSSDREVRHAIREFNEHEGIDGILLQLPLPPQLDSDSLLLSIDPSKDADGLHPFNQGLLMHGQGSLRPCTPQGAMMLIDLALAEHPIDLDTVVEVPQASLAGKRAIVIGRSILVGKPMALLLLERNATVTVAHSRSPDIAQLCREADIVVAAVGVPELVKGDWIKEGAIVIDVGINRREDGRLVGDVAFDEASKRAGAITPVPGGAGPMTIAVLIRNTYLSYAQRIGN